MSPRQSPQKHSFSFGKRVGHWLEWASLSLFLKALGALPMATASNMMGWLGRHIGPCIKQTRIAKRNLRQSFPDWTDEQVDSTVSAMWENLARYFGELPHVAGLTKDGFLNITEVVGAEHYHAAINSGKGSLFFSAHMGNWEWGAKTAWVLGTPFSIVYRPLNNPHAEALTTGIRNHYQKAGIPKSSAGGRELISTLKRGEPVAILIDQKMRSSGIPIPFFGKDAPTSTALADMSLRYDCPIVPTRVERVGKNRFRVTFEPVLDTSGKNAEAIMNDAHRVMERWIAEKPAQWFWVHKRWG